MVYMTNEGFDERMREIKEEEDMIEEFISGKSKYKKHNREIKEEIEELKNKYRRIDDVQGLFIEQIEKQGEIYTILFSVEENKISCSVVFKESKESYERKKEEIVINYNPKEAEFDYTLEDREEIKAEIKEEIKIIDDEAFLRDWRIKKKNIGPKFLTEIRKADRSDLFSYIWEKLPKGSREALTLNNFSYGENMLRSVNNLIESDTFCDEKVFEKEVSKRKNKELESLFDKKIQKEIDLPELKRLNAMLLEEFFYIERQRFKFPLQEILVKILFKDEVLFVLCRKTLKNEYRVMIGSHNLKVKELRRLMRFPAIRP
jgi:hypothetical protein